MAVFVGVEKSGVLVAVLVGVEKLVVLVLVTVLVMSGVLVDTFGTQSNCPIWMIVEDPMQFAVCNCGTMVR